jgi:autotransporter-associated beta strand protein
MKKRGIRMGVVGLVLSGFALACAGTARAEEQVWNDAGPNNIWSASEANWAGGAVWTNGNSAVFAGGEGTLFGETVDIAAAVTAANVIFQTNGYVVADANKDGALSVVGSPSVFTVVNAGDTGTVSAAIGGSGGFVKAGNGTLNLTATNTYSGTTLVSNGTLRLAPGIQQGLGATGTGNETVVAAGATLDVNSAYSGNVNEDFVIAGTGVNGIGALVNAGPTDYYNVGYRNLTLSGNAAIGVYRRFDMAGNGAFTGNGYTLTKIGGAEMAISRAVNGSPIVINAGNYTIQHASALGSTDYPTTLNGGKLQAWGGYTIAERLYINGGTLSASGTGANTLGLAGNMTLNSNVTVQTDTSIMNAVELTGVMDGAGGFTRAGNGYVYVMGDANTYAGPTIVNGGSRLWVGKTVGGTGRLGSGVVTNNGTLYANSPVLGTGEVVNNAGASLYLNPPLLDSGSLVNKGTVYGTSVLQTASGIVNSGTWNSYSGAFGTGSLTNSGTLNLYTNVFTYGQFVNGGTLNLWLPMTFADPVTLNGGSVYVNGTSNTLYLTGPVTVSASAAFGGTASSVIELSGKISGPGGLTRSGDGLCFVTGDENDYTGPTIVNAGKSLWVGKPAGEAGGRLGAGAITNNGTLYFDSVGAYTNFNGINGTGVTAIRYGGQFIVSGGVSSNYNVHVANGMLTLTDGAIFSAYNEMTIANRQTVNYVVAPTNCLLPTNVFAVVTVNDGCALIVKSVTFGNGGDLTGGTMTGILNQVGGIVRTTGAAAEDNGVRLGHYPQTRSFYNMMGGTLIVENNYDLGCATDGQGWFNMTGGEVFATRVMLNERDNAGGYGRLTVAGGVLNIGTVNAAIGPATNAITADNTAPYLVEYGGAGGVIRAVTNIFLPLNAALFGTGANAITFDSANFAISLSGNLSGAGGLNKAGSGTLVLSGANTYGGATRILAGALTPASPAALPTGGTLLFGVSADGSSGKLSAPGDLSLAGIVVGVANPEALVKGTHYTVAAWGGERVGAFNQEALPEPWYVYYDAANKRAELRSEVGTLIRVK